MKLLQLTKGQVTQIDDADYEHLSQWRWRAKWNPCTHSYYAARNIWVVSPDGKRQCRFVSMSRLILGLTDSKIQADHKNGDTLDNQRENLRAATPAQNAANRKRRKTNTSGFKGVSYYPKTKSWRARIHVAGKGVFLGDFKTKEEAHAAYQKKALELFGEFVRNS